MKEYKYEYTRYRYLGIPGIVLWTMLCMLFAKAIIDQAGSISMYAIMVIAIFSLYLLKVAAISLYHLIVNAPHTLIIDNDNLIVKKLFSQTEIELKDIQSIIYSSQFFKDNVFNIKITLHNSRNIILLMSNMDIKNIIKDILAINKECIFDNSLIDDSNTYKVNRKYKYIYPWYNNFQLGFSISLIVSYFFAIILWAVLRKPEIYNAIILLVFFIAEIKITIHLLLFFINKPYEFELFEDKLLTHIGINIRHEIPIKEVEKIYYTKGFYNLFCIQTKQRKIYFGLDLTGYKTMIEMLKHKNPNIEIDHKSIFAAEEKERKRKR